MTLQRQPQMLRYQRDSWSNSIPIRFSCLTHTPVWTGELLQRECHRSPMINHKQSFLLASLLTHRRPLTKNLNYSVPRLRHLDILVECKTTLILSFQVSSIWGLARLFHIPPGAFLARRMVMITCVAAISLLLFPADLPLDWGATTFSLLSVLELIFSVFLQRTTILSY